LGLTIDKSAKLWQYLKGVIMNRKHYDDDLVIEGVNFLPLFLSQFKNEAYIKMCFMGYCEIDPIQKLKDIRANPSEAEWTDELNDEQLENLVKRHQIRSKELKAECEIYGLQYFDTSVNFTEVVKETGEFLVGN
jgi:hypothetical protein